MVSQVWGVEVVGESDMGTIFQGTLDDCLIYIENSEQDHFGGLAIVPVSVTKPSPHLA